MRKPIKNLRWWIAGLVFLSTVINYIDRQTLAQLAPLLKREFQISNTEYGYISQAFLIPYTAMYLGAGLLIDRYGTKLVYGVAAAWWSVAAMLRATASSVLGFGVFRFLLGTAESSNFIAAEKVAAEWYPPRDRGTLNGWVQAGAVTGAIVTPILVMTLTERFGMSLIAKPSVPLTIAILCVVLFGHMSWKTNLATLTVDLFPRRIVASVHGLVATGSGIGGALFTAVAGHLIDWKGYTPVFVIMGVLHPIAYLCVRWLVREKAG